MGGKYFEIYELLKDSNNQNLAYLAQYFELAVHNYGARQSIFFIANFITKITFRVQIFSHITGPYSSEPKCIVNNKEYQYYFICVKCDI